MPADLGGGGKVAGGEERQDVESQEPRQHGGEVHPDHREGGHQPVPAEPEGSGVKGQSLRNLGSRGQRLNPEESRFKRSKG